MTLFKDGKANFIQGELPQCRSTGFVIVQRDWAQPRIQGKVGIFSQGAGGNLWMENY